MNPRPFLAETSIKLRLGLSLESDRATEDRFSRRASTELTQSSLKEGPSRTRHKPAAALIRCVDFLLFPQQKTSKSVRAVSTRRTGVRKYI